MSSTAHESAETLTAPQVLAFGTVAVGTIDILDAFIFYGFRGVNPIRIPQTVAAALLGRAAYRGGPLTAMLGTILHYFIAFIIVLTYYAASRKIPRLARSPFVFGPLYGIAVWATMRWLVLPLSHAPRGVLPPGGWMNGILIHALGVGLTTALFASFAPPVSGGER